MASNRTISGIFLGSTGGSLMNRAKLETPLTLMAATPPLVACLWTKFARADWISASLLSPALDSTFSCSMTSKSSMRSPASSRTSLIAFRARLPMSMPQAKRALAIPTPVLTIVPEERRTGCCAAA